MEMFKGIKKKLTSRSNGRIRRLVGEREIGVSQSREPPDRGGKPISPRQIHPSDHIPPVPYSRRSIERSRTAPLKPARFDGNNDVPFCGSQRHTLQGIAYPTTPNICVTGGKIEFIGSPLSSETSGTSSSTIDASPLSPQGPINPRKQPPSSPAYRRKNENGYVTSPRICNRNLNTSRTPFSFYAANDYGNVSPTSSRRSPLRKENIKKSEKLNKTNSLLQRKTKPPSPIRNTRIDKQRSSTMPTKDDSVNEVDALRRENVEVKSQMALLQKEFKQMQNNYILLQQEKEDNKNIVNEVSSDKLSQYQSIVERCNALECANAQLLEEAQLQRQQYEKCLDNVASQLVQAIMVHKNQQEECERLAVQVQTLTHQKANLARLIATKANSFSPTFAASIQPFSKGNNFHSLPNSLTRPKLRQKSKISFSNSSETSQSSEEVPSLPKQCETTCWYDVIKNNSEAPSSEVDSLQNAECNKNTTLTSFPSNIVQTFHSSGHSTNTPAKEPVYSTSSNQELIVNFSITQCVTSTSFSPPLPKITDNRAGTSKNRLSLKLPHLIKPIDRKISCEIIKDEGYSTMSSDVQSETKEKVTKEGVLFTIEAVEEEKTKQCDDVNDEHINTESNKSDELRSYDDEEDNSDVVLIAIRNKKNESNNSIPLYNCTEINRSYSDSDLSIPNVNSSQQIIKRLITWGQSSLPYHPILKKKLINLQINPLDSVVNAKLRKNKTQSKTISNNNSYKEESNSLTASYSQAEMEDWSLDISAEDLATPAEIDSSCSNVRTSQPSVPDSNFEMEEDQQEFLWNGATYLKNDWQNNKTWDIRRSTIGENRNLLSPKSGCSDQPAHWSSSEQLSCSDIASKCSTDIENFCDQLCKLPELKRRSLGSIEASNERGLISKLSEAGSLEDNLDINPNAVDNAFTRDFYRLIKFESTKSLTDCSVKSLEDNSCLTMEKVRLIDDSLKSKTLASVLGYIAEQQKYCEERELMDKNSSQNESCLKKNSTNEKPDLQINSVPSSTSINSKASDAVYRNKSPIKPQRSSSLYLSAKVTNKGTLPILLDRPPSPPSRSSSKTLPRHSFHFEHESPPPPYELIHIQNEYVEPVKSNLPPIPPHRLLPPSIPERTCSKSYNSPPVPKRITSRALPQPPAAINNAKETNTSETNEVKVGNGIEHPIPTPNRSTSLLHEKFKRSKSLLKESTSRIHPKQRSSCGNFESKTQESFLQELKRLAQDEDESNTERSEPESPGDLGLGTGWIHIEPRSELANPKNRINVTENMMPSSEPCSSENDETFNKKKSLPIFPKTSQKNRRKRKVSRLKNEDNGSPVPRPSIIDNRSLFTRYGTEEEDALQSFNFLNGMSSTSSEDCESPMPKTVKNLDDLRSSEPCDTQFPRNVVDYKLYNEAPRNLSKINNFANNDYSPKTSKQRNFYKLKEKYRMQSDVPRLNIETCRQIASSDNISKVRRLKENFERNLETNVKNSSSQKIGIKSMNVKDVIKKFSQQSDATNNNEKCNIKINYQKSDYKFQKSQKIKNKFETKRQRRNLSISDSCAELVSPLSSEEDTFSKISFT